MKRSQRVLLIIGAWFLTCVWIVCSSPPFALVVDNPYSRWLHGPLVDWDKGTCIMMLVRSTFDMGLLVVCTAVYMGFLLSDISDLLYKGDVPPPPAGRLRWVDIVMLLFGVLTLLLGAYHAVDFIQGLVNNVGMGEVPEELQSGYCLRLFDAYACVPAIPPLPPFNHTEMLQVLSKMGV